MQRLINEDTLIMTAAAKDRTSFGCGTKSDFTYFGQAVFVDQLAKNKTFLESFENARGLIESREKAEKLTPSLPQLHIGHNIRARIESLQAELNLHYHR